MSRWVRVVAGMVVVLALGAQSAAAKDYAQTARNIIPSGQPGVPGPGADTQALMYDGLTPLFDNVTNADLSTSTSSRRSSASTPTAPARSRPCRMPGVTIIRDKFDVPHVHATTHDGGIWAAGWIAAEDRGLLLQQARNNARVAAIDAPGLERRRPDRRPAELPAERPDRERGRPSRPRSCRTPARRARRCSTTSTSSSPGSTTTSAIHSPSTPPLTRNDIYALNALKGQFVGQGGGDEARRSEFLGGLEQRSARSKGMSVFNDLRQNNNNDSPTTVDGNFPYGRHPRPGSRGSVVLDPGSFTLHAGRAAKRDMPKQAATEPARASNELMIDAKHSATGHPLLVGGPQIGYFFPGFTYEIDMHARGLVWRGATSAPFPGYMLIGRGADFATTLTSSSGDIIDQYAETLCGGSDTKYLYKGKCRTMGTFNAGHPERRPGQRSGPPCTGR